MALAIISADQRMQSASVKGMIWGQAGVGKTSLLKTLDPATTLCLDFEAGLLSVQRDDERGPAWRGDSIKVENWPEAVAILKSFQAKAPFLAKYRTVFVDSISVATKQCFDWAMTQPEAWSDKKQKADTLGAYGLLGLKAVEWCQDWKHLDGVNVWMVGGLERKEIDGIKEWVPLTTGAKLANALPYIMDYSLVMAAFKAENEKIYTGLFTDPRKNPEYASVPVKSRVAGLAQIEQPHLGKLMAKALGFSPIAAPPPSTVATEPGDGASTPLQTTQSEAA